MAASDDTQRNRLATQSSAYLQQHADNPVDWFPWGDEALTLARTTDKPILLSIGYASCHWCHVMAHESFADTQCAAVMNEHFVNIKVDREERPDIDQVYQLAHQLMNRSTGGWPLTVFIDPLTHLPFFAGTYFPKTPRHQLPGFIDLLHRIQQGFTENREALNEQSGQIGAIFGQLNELYRAAAEQGEMPSAQALLQQARDELLGQYDSSWGGFGAAPKFPNPTAIERLLNHWAYQRAFENHSDREALDAVMRTLTEMARGAIFDQLGGGFCRYATDREWRIPHFEKMLYDNAQMLGLYADALKVGPDPLFEQVISLSLDWLEQTMTGPHGAFYASQDADSGAHASDTQGSEGRFYTWRREELKRALSEDEYLFVETLYGLDKPANFENRWTLARRDSFSAVAHRLSLDNDDAQRVFTSATDKMRSLRAERIHPATDHKILCAWNGLMIDALVRVAAAPVDTQLRERALHLAHSATSFIQENLWDQQTRTLHHCLQESLQQDLQQKQGESDATMERSGRAFLDDYAALLKGITHLLQLRWSDEHARFARAIADTLLNAFQEDEQKHQTEEQAPHSIKEAPGGFFFTPDDAETLIYRAKPAVDDALPSGNGMAARALTTLGHLYAEPAYLDAAARAVSWGCASASKAPSAHCELLSALELQHYLGTIVILQGPPGALREWQDAIGNSPFRPWLSVFAIPSDAGRTALPPQLPRMQSLDGQSRTTAYVCEGSSCSAPITELDTLLSNLGISS